jgi:hypothetical protein
VNATVWLIPETVFLSLIYTRRELSVIGIDSVLSEPNQLLEFF